MVNNELQRVRNWSWQSFGQNPDFFPKELFRLTTMQCWLADERNTAMEYWWPVNDGETELAEKKSVQVPQSPQQIPNGLEWDRTRFSSLTAQERANPISCSGQRILWRNSKVIQIRLITREVCGGSDQGLWKIFRATDKLYK